MNLTFSYLLITLFNDLETISWPLKILMSLIESNVSFKIFKIPDLNLIEFSAKVFILFLIKYKKIIETSDNNKKIKIMPVLSFNQIKIK